MIKAEKKIIFIIVEGPSDAEALELCLSKVFADSDIFIAIVHGDVTTQGNTNRSTIKIKVANILKKYLRSEHFKVSDIRRIIHLVDTDGAFVPKAAIKQVASCRKTIYSIDSISTENKTKLEQRNHQKSRCLIELSKTRDIMDIPYSVHFMSCNLEHVLFDRLNCNNDEKENLAYDFARKYCSDIDGFKNFIGNSDFSVHGSYQKSWHFIEQELESLKRHTNLAMSWQETSYFVPENLNSQPTSNTRRQESPLSAPPKIDPSILPATRPT